MPESGFCTDSRCSKEIQRLYECHCCLQLICLNHLNEHEIEKQTKEKLYSLTEELRRRIDSVQLSMVNRLSMIEQEKKFLEREKMFIEQANHFLDGQIYSIEQMEEILEEFNQLVQTNGLKETIVKVESSSSLNVTNHPLASQYLNEHTSRNELSSEILSSKSKSPVCLDLTEDSGEREKEIRREEMESSMCMDDHLVESTSLNQNDDSFQYNDENKKLDISPTGFRGCCPLTFDGAYGLSQSKHSIRLCSNKKHRSCGLYRHFRATHQFTTATTRRLIIAMAKNQNPLTTKLFDDNEDIIDHSYRTECPFRKGMNDLFDCHKKISVRRVPCPYQSLAGYALKYHLKHYHDLTEDLANKFAQHYRTKNNHLSPS